MNSFFAVPEIITREKSIMTTLFWTGATIALLVAAASILFTVALVAFIQLILKSTTAYKVGIEHALRSLEVSKLIGLPVKPGFFVGGRVKNAFSNRGYTSLRTKLKGSLGEGKLEIFARRKSNGGLRFETLKFYCQGNTVDLLAEILAARQIETSKK